MIPAKKLVILIYSLLLVCSWTYASDIHTPIAWKFYLPNYNVYADAGIYKITYSDVTKYNINPALLDLGKISIQNKNKDIPIFVSRSTGIWSPADYIEFYGEPPKDKSGNEDPYTKENVYWLIPQSEAPKRILSVNSENGLQPSNVFKPNYFLNKVHMKYEIKVRYFTDLTGTFPKIWYWDELRAPQTLNKDFIDFSDLATESNISTIPIRISLQGDSYPPVSPSHHAIFRMNGKEIGQCYWDGRKPYTFDTTFPISWVKSGLNTLSIEAPGDIKSNPPMDVFLLDSLDYIYPKKFNAEGDRIAFSGEGESLTKTQYDMSGFQSNNIQVFDLEKDYRITPQVVQDTKQPNLFDAQFVDISSKNKKYFAFTPNACQKPSRCEPVYPSDLKDTTNKADYVILTYDAFVPELDRLVKWREKQGHLVKVVKVSDVYNEFNAGIFSPEAIKSFVDYAYHKWSGPRIKYLFLIGHANFDYKDNLKDMWKISNVDLMPTCLYLSRASNIVSDNVFVALDSSSPYPSLAVGRLNVLTKEEVRDYVDKVLDYESSTTDNSWKSRSLLVAGDFQMFTSDLDSLAKEYLLPLYDVIKAYASPAPALTVGEKDEVARGILHKALQDGVSLVYFAGHGSNGLWANRKLLMKEDIPLMKNNKYPIILSMTCFSGRFEYANDTAYDQGGVCELLVRQKKGGAIASFGSSGRAYVSTDSQLGRAILKGILQDHLPLLGDAIVQAKKSISDSDMVYGYTLFGDPALKVAVPENNVALLVAKSSSSTQLTINGKCEKVSDAQGTLEFIDHDGKVLSTQEINCQKGSFQKEVQIKPESLNSLKYIRCTLVDKKTGKEELGGRPSP